MSDNSVIAKSGWLLKLNNEGWYRGWFELYRDGFLKYYENDHSPNPEDIIFIPSECILIKTGSQVSSDEMNMGRLPASLLRVHSSQCVFSMSTSNKVWHLCGDSLDDMRAWQLALEQARLLILPSRTVPRVAYASVLEMSSYPDCNELRGRNVYGSPPPMYLPAYSTGSYTYYPQSNDFSANSLVSSIASSNVVPLSAHASSLSQDASHLLHHHPHRQPLLPHPRPDSRDVALGMLAGAAVGSVVWGSPYYWWQ